MGFLALLVTGWIAYARAEASLRRAAVNQLRSIRGERQRQIEAHFADVRRDALTFSESHDIAAALREITSAHRELEAEVLRWPVDARDRFRRELERYYETAFTPRLRALETARDARDYVPADSVTQVMQALFIAGNPNPDAARDRLDRPAGGGAYAQAHARFNPLLRTMARRRGYDDLFLIAQDGRVVYTVAKKVDFGTSLMSGPYRDTRLSRAFRAARSAVDADFVRLVDFESYAPSLGAPAAFVAAPIFERGRRLGVVALQLSLDPIDAVMTGDRRWKDGGLGRTGETFLVGPDFRMRSDSRFFLEAPESYFETAQRTGVPADVIQLMRTHRRTVLFQPITSAAARAAVEGRSGVATQLDYREQPVLTTYAPLAIADLQWGLVAKLDTAEAFAPAVALRRALTATAAVVALLVAAAALVLARSLTAPIRRLIAAMGTLGQGDLEQRLTERRRDEIGQIATAFNRMAADLQATTVSRDHVSSILDSMSDAVIVVRLPDGSADWREAVIVTVNPAACTMLDRDAEALVGQPVGRLIPAIGSSDGAGGAGGDGAAGVWLEEVLRQGRLGGREAVYKIHDGRQIPVLFSTALVRRSATSVDGIVLAAHDLTELKATEARTVFIRETFGRYVSADVVASLLSSPERLELGGELRKVTVLMSDLRGFTALAERLAPEDAIRFLNGYLQTMVDLILHYRGTINEIMGDGILVIFGAPTAAADDAERAVACALAMQLAMDGVNERSRTRGLPEVEMGIGVHTGQVIVGNIGSDRRMKYAAVGSPVNLTGRIESFTTGGQVLISESTLQEVGSIVRVGCEMQIQPKGARRAVTVWEAIGIGGVHELYLREAEVPLVALAKEIPIRHALVENKLVNGHVHDGSIVQLSARGAEIRSTVPVAPLSDVKIWLAAGAPELEPAEIYAKVVERTEGGFVVRFTAMPPGLVEGLLSATPRSG